MKRFLIIFILLAALWGSFFIAERALNMNITQRPSPNHTVGRQGWIPDIIVCHITEGTFPGSINWVTNSQSQVSYHFMISRRGEVTQCVNIRNMAWANGTTNNNDSRDNRHSLITNVRNRRVNANLFTISIGFEGLHREMQGGLVLAQLEAAVNLIKFLREEVRRIWDVIIPVNRTHIVGHVDITPRTRPYCPGVNFPYAEIIRRLNAENQIPPPLPSFKVGDIVQFTGGGVFASYKPFYSYACAQLTNYGI